MKGVCEFLKEPLWAIEGARYYCDMSSLALLGALTVALPMSWNDGSGSIGVGGTVGLREGTHPTIRMVDEEIRVKLPERTVRVVFHFKNEGPATTALMAFPENGYLGGQSLKEKKQNASRSHFGYFRTYLDGQRMHPRLMKGGLDPEEEMSYENWWVKKVPFAKGQTRTVVNEYRGGEIWREAGSYRVGFEYVLQTGASWKGGKIGRTRVIVDARDVRNNGPLEFATTAAWKRSGRIYTWEGRNFKPKEDIQVWWTDGGFTDIVVDGKPLDSVWTQEMNGAWDGGKGLDSYPRPPVLRGSMVWAEPSVVRVLAGAGGKGRRFARGGKVSRPRADVRGWVPLAQVVRDLGGKAFWSGNRLVVIRGK